jgi:hypothetical protein
MAFGDKKIDKLFSDGLGRWHGKNPIYDKKDIFRSSLGIISFPPKNGQCAFKQLLPDFLPQSKREIKIPRIHGLFSLVSPRGCIAPFSYHIKALYSEL